MGDVGLMGMHVPGMAWREIRDAAVLAEQLAAADAGELDLPAAIGRYEDDMRAFAYPVMEMSADHDGRFGGGGIRKARGEAPA